MYVICEAVIRSAQCKEKHEAGDEHFMWISTINKEYIYEEMKEY